MKWLWIAYFESSNFAFEGFGDTEKQARHALESAIMRGHP